jgi:hypothetical protein
VSVGVPLRDRTGDHVGLADLVICMGK